MRLWGCVWSESGVSQCVGRWLCELGLWSGSGWLGLAAAPSFSLLVVLWGRADADDETRTTGRAWRRPPNPTRPRPPRRPTPGACGRVQGAAAGRGADAWAVDGARAPLPEKYRKRFPSLALFERWVLLVGDGLQRPASQRPGPHRPSREPIRSTRGRGRAWSLGSAVGGEQGIHSPKRQRG